MSRVRNSLLNISTGLIGQALSLLVSFAVRSVFIYVLGSTYLGLSGLFGNILSLLSFAELGFGQAIIYALYKPIAENNEEKIAALMALFKKVYVSMFVVVAILGLSITPFINNFINKPVNIPHIHLIYMLYVASSAVSYLFAYKKSLLFANQKTYVATTISYWFVFFGAVLQICVLLLLRDFVVFLLVQIASSILQDITIAKRTDKLYPFIHTDTIAKLPDDDKKQIIKNVKALVIYKVGTLSLNSTDNIIISKFVGLIQVGLYSNYYLISFSIGGFLSTIFANITASIGNLNNSATNDAKLDMFYKINMATFWLYGICGVVLYSCMTPFILLWIGEDYALSNATCFIIAFNQYIGGMLYSSFNYRQTMGLFVQGKLRPIISAVLNVAISIVLAIYYGLPGVLWGTAITRLLTNAWFDPYIVFKRGLKVSPKKYFIDYFIKLIVFSIVCVISGFICSLFDFGVVTNFFLSIVSSFIIATLLFYTYCGYNSQTKYLISIARNSISIIRAKS